MHSHWSFILFGSMLVLSAAWYGYNFMFGTDNSPSSSLLPYSSSHQLYFSSPHRASHQSLAGSSSPCHCQCLVPMTARAERVLRKIRARSLMLQRRADGEGDGDVPDLSQLSDQELKDLLGLPEQAQITHEELVELQRLVSSGDITLSVLKEIGEEISKNYVDYQDGMTDGMGSGPVSAQEGGGADTDEMVDVDNEDYGDQFVSSTPSSSFVIPEAVGDDSEDEKEVENSAVASESSLGNIRDYEDNLDPVGDTAPQKTKLASPNNPFPARPFPSKYADISHDILQSDPGHDHTLSYIHPVRTFKFRLFVPTFAEIFGFQLASQTIIELYVAKQPGPRERTGIPDAFYEQKYWNVLMEVDGNKVISTLPSAGLADQAEVKTSSLSKRFGEVHDSSVSGSAPSHHEQNTRTKSHSYRRPPDPLFDGHTKEDLERFAEREQLKNSALNSYKERMSVQRYRKWLKEVLT